MEFDKKTVRTVALAAFAVLAGYWCLQNLSPIEKALKALMGLVSPFLLGCAIAFILNVPMRAVERHLGDGGKHMDRFRRPLAFVLTLALVAGVLALASLIIVPNLGDAVSSVIQQAQSFLTRLPATLAELEARLPELQAVMNETFVEYSGSLFSFEEVKAEMDYIRRKQKRGGKVSVKGFIGGLLILSEQDEFSL